MERLLSTVLGVSKVLNGIAGGAATLMICITVVDVFLRGVGHPVVGAYEIIGLICGPIVIGFAVSQIVTGIMGSCSFGQDFCIALGWGFGAALLCLVVLWCLRLLPVPAPFSRQWWPKLWRRVRRTDTDGH